MTEYIGSRISLISKSDIRYCGTLHEINSENSTVALENVFSYGTEGRKGKPEEEIAPSDTPYEYIVFRGSDVKDLRIEDAVKENKPPPPPQMPNDPAILGASRPPPQGGPPNQNQFPNQPPQHPQSHQPQFPGPGPQYPGFQGQHFGPPGGFHGGPQGRGGPGGPGGFPPGYPGMGYGAPPPGWFPPGGSGNMGPGQFPPHQMPPGAPQQPQEIPAQEVGGGPTPGSAKDNSKNVTPKPLATKPGPPPPPVESKPPVNAALAPASQAAATSSTQAPSGPASRSAPSGPKSNRVVPAVPMRGARAPAGRGQAASASQNAQTQNATQAATAAVAAAMAKLPQPGKPAQSTVPNFTTTNAMDNLTQKVANMRAADPANQTRGGRGSHDNHYHGRGGRGQRRGGGGQHHQQAPKVEIPKTDFDFEESNAKFNKQDLVKEAIASGTPTEETSLSNGAGGSAEAGAAVNGSGDTSATTYNKTTSFFDNISSELKDRTQSNERVGGPQFRSEERKKNVETFGQGSIDGGGRGYRGGFRGRGRGGFRGRGRGGGHRGRGGNLAGAGTEAGPA